MLRKSKQPIDRSTLMQSSNGTLAKIAIKTKFLTNLTNVVQQICPDIPDHAYKIANFHQSAIIIEVTTSVWGQRLQFERMKIAKALSELSKGKFNHIEIKINPLTSKVNNYYEYKNKNQKPRSHYITASAAEQITQLANNENAPKALKDKLLRLAALAK
ncbi:MAG: DciA family protein [Woeseiaceae bacterium]